MNAAARCRETAAGAGANSTATQAGRRRQRRAPGWTGPAVAQPLRVEGKPVDFPCRAAGSCCKCPSGPANCTTHRTIPTTHALEAPSSLQCMLEYVNCQPQAAGLNHLGASLQTDRQTDKQALHNQSREDAAAATPGCRLRRCMRGRALTVLPPPLERRQPSPGRPAPPPPPAAHSTERRRRATTWPHSVGQLV